MQISSPKGIRRQFPLPEVTSGEKIVVDAGTGVFAAGAPLEFNIRAAKEGTALVVAASCRGAPAGVQTLVATLHGHDHGANPVVVPLDEQAAGVIRLTVYDYSGSPPQLVARRLVYRKPARWLTVRAAEQPKPYAPGGKASLTLIVADENGKPVPATLGISVVDSRLLHRAGDSLAGAAAPLLPGGELEGPADLQGADFFRSDDKDAAEAMELMLGTQSERPGADAGPPPLVIDNLTALQAYYEKSLAEYQEPRRLALDALVALCFFGGLGLLLLVTMLALMKVVSGRYLWLPTMVAAACFALIGLSLMDPGRAKIERKVVPFAGGRQSVRQCRRPIRIGQGGCPQDPDDAGRQPICLPAGRRVYGPGRRGDGNTLLESLSNCRPGRPRADRLRSARAERRLRCAGRCAW